MNDAIYSRPRTLLIALLACGPAAAQAADGGLLKDPSFERALPADEGGWKLFELSTISKDHARTGERCMRNSGFSRTVPHHPFFIGHASGAFQEFPAKPGSRWRLTGYGFSAKALKGKPAFGILQVSFFDAKGKDLGTAETAGADTKAKASNPVNGQTPIGKWISLDTGIATAPPGTTSVQAFTLYVDYSNSGVSQGVCFDDLTLLEVSGKDAAKPAGGASP